MDDNNRKKPLMWDSGSSLYDSFELKSFQRHLDSAIISSSRSLSMPHLSDHRTHHPDPPPHKIPKKPSKLSRSLNKLVRSIFGPKQSNNSNNSNTSSNSASSWFKGQNGNFERNGFHFFYDGSGALTTIPEVPEVSCGVSPDVGAAVVGRSASERFTAASVGISCA